MIPSSVAARIVQISSLNLKRCNVLIIRCTASKPRCLMPLNSCNLQVLRYVRTHKTGSSSHESSASSKSETSSSDDGKSEDGPKTEQPELPKFTPEQLKRLRMFMMIIVLITFGMSFVAIGSIATHPNPDVAKALELEPVEFDEFIAKFLPTGEVKTLVYFPQQKRAVALLEPGAMIDGKPFPVPVVPIKVDRVNPDQPDQFRLEVRHFEEKLGIPLRDGVQIEVFRGISMFRVIEAGIGFMILAFLMSQYGRLVRRTILKKRAEEAAKTKGTKSP